ncbi:Glycosyltransferase family 2 protein [Mycena chlorophos]|uniref:chitin synthase n=1 Tax=Mycena chlorophos TaxID=658473 RepID=A0A8H6THG7_MYCCL|nr:Glycosyltransferase family 2 protein [Mycena chlorophos]
MSNTELNPKTTTYEFLGPPGALAVTIGVPVMTYALYFGCSEAAGGCPPSLATDRVLLALQDPAWWKGLWDTQAFLMYLGWYAFCLVAWVVVPGDIVQGTLLRTGVRKNYKINAFGTFLLALGLTAGTIYRYGPGSFTFLHDKFVGFITASIIMAVVQAVACYAASFRPGALLALGGNSGNPIYDFYIGRELNPFSFGAFDLKTFNELRPGLILWVLLDISMVCEQATRRGGFSKVTDSLWLAVLFHGWYVADALFNESGIFTQMDITTDGFGFMLAVGDLAWVPFVYCLQARYLVFTPNELGPVYTALILAVNFSGYYIFREANGEKNDFRNGKNPKNLQYFTTESGSKLLTSGWWGRSRHPNYFGDILMALAWSLPTGFVTPITYFYVTYFAVLLVHRQRRDDHFCHVKYGKDWIKDSANDDGMDFSLTYFHPAAQPAPAPAKGSCFSSSRRMHSDDPPPRSRSSYPLTPTTATANVSQISFLTPDPETGSSTNVSRKRSLVRPDRQRIGPGHRQWHYHNRVAELEEEREHKARPRGGVEFIGAAPGLRRGKSILGREQDLDDAESKLALFGRTTTLRRRRRTPEESAVRDADVDAAGSGARTSCFGDYAPGPKGPWMLYCFLLTWWIPVSLMSRCGLRSREQQRAWREKIGLVAVILLAMGAVGFITFGFTEVVCGGQANTFHGGAIGDDFIGSSSVTINGYDYDFSTFKHPAAGEFNGSTNPLDVPGWSGILGGNDASFLFQRVNQHCLGLITKPSNSNITGTGEELDWYFPCNVRSQYGSTAPNTTNYASSTNCHTSSTARSDFSAFKPQGQVYFTWPDVHNTSRNLAVFESNVLDLELLNWLDKSEVTYPSIFDDMKTSGGSYSHKDLTMLFYRMNMRSTGQCLQDIITVGYIDSTTIGCVASKIVLYVSLVVIVGIVGARFVMACIFQWFFSRRIGNFPEETREERKKRAAEIEAWSDGIYLPAPSRYRPDVTKNGVAKSTKNRKSFFPVASRFTPALSQHYGALDQQPPTFSGSRPKSVAMSLASARSSVSPAFNRVSQHAVPQPRPDYEPFNFPLAHTICLVTAYSESDEGLRTTFDSLATTDYPNSHKLILVIADGMVKGAGNALTTPEICLGMMRDLVVPADEVEAHSYVAIADGHKRHNMAKIYAGFYAYDNATTERSKQQRVPMILVAKCGNPLEKDDAKPGNRGKRDSQMVLMAFLQKVMFDERMTTLEYQLFNAFWGVTGFSPDRYQLVLAIDADTKAFPDSLSRMVACMVHDTEIMGLCGETKIANKADSWVTMMQVFEYYISHHLTKAFESLFGGVSCLPGCFSMYRIKAPKGDNSDYWIPILANPDVVEKYSENVVDTLHKKNLLLLGEDRYLTTLMLKAFPKRKNIFCQQAICKTIVPDTFRVLLSQRRRWINSTVHNLFELVLVRESCGTFCFSMQFMLSIELLGTLVLPAAISFTFYLIISSIIPGGPNTTIPLVLLALVLGLPGVLIVITSTKVIYVWWMLVYLASLVIWNGVLPAYAFWHFDDFSWGETRKVTGDTKAHTGDKEGQFDSSHIVMKRWGEFERERRFRQGQWTPSSRNRMSLGSMSIGRSSLAGFEGGFNTANLYRESMGVVRMPMPLSSGASASVTSPAASTEDAYETDIYDDLSPPPSTLLHTRSSQARDSLLTSSPSRLLESPIPTPEFEYNPYLDEPTRPYDHSVDSVDQHGPVEY